MEDSRQPLLSPSPRPREVQNQIGSITNNSFASTSFDPNANDIPPIKSVADFFREFYKEFIKLWYIGGPALFTTICQYSLATLTSTLSGQVGTLELAAVSIENSVIAGFTMGIMLGMGSALETLSGQAFGARQLDMLGIYLQRSWIIVCTTALLLSALYIFATPLLNLIGQKPDISKAAGTFAIWMLPQLFAYAFNYPMVKFLQSQSKMMAMALIAAAALVLHTVLSWLLMLKLKWGLVGAAIVLDASWWFICIAQFLYIVSGTCGRAWNGFSWKAFHDLWGFVRLSIASAVMICLEVWYFVALILFAGYMKNAVIAVDGLSTCMNILSWTIMLAMGMNAAVSVRVSNELGADHPRAAKFSAVVAVISALTIGLILGIILLIFRDSYPPLFSNNFEVQQLVKKLTPLLAFSIVINSFQPTLSGVAIGAGWQAVVAYVNIGCYYLFGIPLGLILGYKVDIGVRGIWYGMLAGTVLQTLILFSMVFSTNWNKEASAAEGRIRKWGGHNDSNENHGEKMTESRRC